MDGPSIIEEHVHRLTGVPRATRQGWAKDDLVAKQTSPYPWGAVRELVVLTELRGALGASCGDAVFRQLRAGLATVSQSARPLEAIVDVHTLRAEWISSDGQVVAFVRSGDPVRIIDVAQAVARAREGFDIAASDAAATKDELASRRARPRQRKTSQAPT